MLNKNQKRCKKNRFLKHSISERIGHGDEIVVYSF